MKLLKKTLVVLLFLLLGFNLPILTFLEYRHFYPLGNGETITVWKQWGGKCYIFPYKYYGLWNPKKNYLVTDNFNYVTIVWEKDSLMILNGYEMEMNLNLPDYKYNYYSKDNYNVFISRYFLKNNEGDDVYRRDIHFLAINIKELLSFTDVEYKNSNYE